MSTDVLFVLVPVVIVALFGLWVTRHQAKSPHGKCAYCGAGLAMVGPRAKKCRKCDRVQPWVSEGQPPVV